MTLVNRNLTYGLAPSSILNIIRYKCFSETVIYILILTILLEISLVPIRLSWYNSKQILNQRIIITMFIYINNLLAILL